MWPINVGVISYSMPMVPKELVFWGINHHKTGDFWSISYGEYIFKVSLSFSWIICTLTWYSDGSHKSMPGVTDMMGYLHICAAFPDNYVYDYYAVRDDMDITEENAASPFPL